MIKRGLQATFNSIKKHKRLFALIVILQLIFVVASMALGAHYLIKILENAQGIIQPLENGNYDSQLIEQGKPFTPDYAAIYNSYQGMLRNVLYFFICMTALGMVLNGTIWLLSYWILQEKKAWKTRIKEGMQFLLKIWVSTLLLLGPFLIASYYLLLHFIRLSDSFTKIAVVLKALLVALFVVQYFLLSAFALAPISSWKKFATSWVRLSLKNFHKTIQLFFVIGITLLLSFALLYAATEYSESAVLLLLLGAFCMVVVAVTRIFWIAGVQEIDTSSTK